MKVGIVSNNNLNQQNNRITFQGKPSPESLIRDGILISCGKNTGLKTRRLRQIITALADSSSTLIDKVRFELVNSELLRRTTRSLKSKQADIDTKKDMIAKIFVQKSYEPNIGGGRSTIISDYISSTLVPYIAKTKDKELAKYVLSLMEETSTEPNATTILNEVELMKTTGDKKHIAKLRGYINRQDGLPEYMHEAGYHNDRETIRKEATKAINALKAKTSK